MVLRYYTRLILTDHLTHKTLCANILADWIEDDSTGDRPPSVNIVAAIQVEVVLIIVANSKFFEKQKWKCYSKKLKS